MSAIKRFLLWDWGRATWQYDIMVAAILAFIFLTPKDFFRDQPRASDIVRLPAEHGAQVFFLEPELLNGTLEAQRGSEASRLLRGRDGVRNGVTRVEPVFGSEGEIKGFMAFVKP
ncbi:MAG TPA: hypothetical protein VES20_16365 [Bryobacteraceae bacterium]|nr:hypothetical protein [Bryobacteraceae bacterium]